jgi:hypothetical protein
MGSVLAGGGPRSPDDAFGRVERGVAQRIPASRSRAVVAAASTTTSTNGALRHAASAPTATPTGRAQPPSTVLTATSATSRAVAPRSTRRSTRAETAIRPRSSSPVIRIR